MNAPLLTLATQKTIPSGCINGKARRDERSGMPNSNITVIAARRSCPPTTFAVGTPRFFSGQDSRAGTPISATRRSSTETEAAYTPLANMALQSGVQVDQLPAHQKPRVLGFEYGYNLTTPRRWRFGSA